MAIDLRTDAGRDVLYRLVARADVFVTNLPLDTRRRHRVTYEDLAPLNPRLIYGSVTAYGEAGEEASRPGFDSTALWARTGLMDLVRPSPDAAPSRSLPGMGDHPTGMSLFGAIMAALYRRERTGKGALVSTSLMANGRLVERHPGAGDAERRALRAAAAAPRGRQRPHQPLLLPGRPLVPHGAHRRRPEVGGLHRGDRPAGSPRRPALRHRGEPPRQRARRSPSFSTPCSWIATGRSGASACSRAASPSASWARSRTFRTTRRCTPAARSCRWTTRAPAPASP